MEIQPYLFFEGRCEEAIEFYRIALGAEVEFLMHYKDAPPQDNSKDGGNGPKPMPPGDKVMHSNLRIAGAQIMMSDGHCSGKLNFQGISISLTVDAVEEAEYLFAGLANGGQVIMPLTETFYSPRFGMVDDKFGVSWMIMVKQPC